MLKSCSLFGKKGEHNGVFEMRQVRKLYNLFMHEVVLHDFPSSPLPPSEKSHEPLARRIEPFSYEYIEITRQLSDILHFQKWCAFLKLLFPKDQ